MHKEELNYLYSSPNILQVIKSRRMRWAGHVARMGEERGVYRVFLAAGYASGMRGIVRLTLSCGVYVGGVGEWPVRKEGSGRLGIVLE